MADNTSLSTQEVTEALASLPDWSVQDDSLYKRFAFSDFIHAFSFMTSCAVVAEKLQHHPAWKNVYNVVEVWLSTHDVGGITQKDVLLAQKMEEVVKHFADK